VSHTIRKNIAFNAIGPKPMPEVKAASGMPECHGFRTKQPQGFDYIDHERGQNFSAVSGMRINCTSLLKDSRY